MSRYVFGLCLVVLIILTVSPNVMAGCVMPKNNFILTDSAVLCKKNYSLIGGISIASDNVTLNCNRAEIKCISGIDIGIRVEGHKRVTIKNCIVSECQNGISLINSPNGTIVNNVLHNNKVGIAIQNSHNTRVVTNNLTSNGDSILAISSKLNIDEIMKGNFYDTIPVLSLIHI